MLPADMSDICQAAPIGTKWLSPALVCFLLGLVARDFDDCTHAPLSGAGRARALPSRLSQSSELQLRGIVRDGAAGGMLCLHH
jgi:hypothetical protein